MFGKKFSTTAKCTLLLALVLVLFVTMFAVTHASLAPSSQQIASAPISSTCAPGPAYGTSPASTTSSRLLAPRCPPLIQPLASWGS
jgi:hypothetical protein